MSTHMNRCCVTVWSHRQVIDEMLALEVEILNTLPEHALTDQETTK